MLKICLIIAGLTLAYVWWRLARSNMTVGENVERTLPPREALQFALDNGLPVSRVSYVPGTAFDLI